MQTEPTRRIGKLLLFKKIYLFAFRDERAYSASAASQSRAGGPRPRAAGQSRRGPSPQEQFPFLKVSPSTSIGFPASTSLSYGR